MNDIAIIQHRIDRAKSLDALSDIARDAEAVMDVEHRSQADRDALHEALRKRTLEFAAMLGAG